MIRKVSRRGFLKGLAAGGLLLGFGPWLLLDDAAAIPGKASTDPKGWLAISPDGIVSIVVSRSEMGQGTRTTLALAIADELEAHRNRIRVVQADGDEALYGSQNTDGSRSVREDLDKLRRVGATARRMLEAAAAAQWGVPIQEVKAQNHEVHHAGSGRKAGYGELAKAAWGQSIPATVTLKSRTDLRYLGKENQPSFDLEAMTRGQASYGSDVVRPGMKFAVIARPSVYGGTVASFDDKAARQVPGVEHVIRLPDATLPNGFRPLGGIAVIASNTWAAMQGRSKLKISWKDGPNGHYDSKVFRKALEATVSKPAQVVLSQGDYDQARSQAKRLIKASYYMPHLAHAPMEPPVATAHVTSSTCEVWAPSQNPQAARRELATALNLPIEQVTVHVTLLGGGFGRKSKPDFIVEAALLSRAVGAPVKVQWTREDEITNDYYHTVSAQHLEAALDASGRVEGWLHRTAFPPIPSTFSGARLAGEGELAQGIHDYPFAIPNLRLEVGEAEAHVRIGWFRAVNNLQHAFAINSFISELAHATGQDEKALWLKLLGSDRTFMPLGTNYGAPAGEHPLETGRLRRVIEVASEKSGWGKKLPNRHGLGIAAHRSFLSYVATVVHVVVDPDGTVHVPQVDTAIDCGFAVNPDRIRAQMEGVAAMGMTLALHGAVTFNKGRAQESNFHDFQIARMPEAPKVVRSWILESDRPPGGVGEPGLPTFTPALCNAIHAATGQRLRSLPIAQQLARP